jgi:8-oxo-dGTP pyrophosphatase MutT (NUDIX family)
LSRHGATQADLVRAAGGVVVRDGLIAVVWREKRQDWTLPKGKLEAGEDDAAAAVREVEEETGWAAQIDADLGTFEYTLPDGRPKTVRWYLMHAVSETRAPADDVDEVRWLDPGQVRALLTYPRDGEILDRANLS